MHVTTPRRRGAAFTGRLARSLALAAFLIPAAASADTPLQNQPSAYKSALSDALGGEHAAFSAFAVTANFARAAGLEPIDPNQDGSDGSREQSLAAVDALGTHDARAASAAEGAQSDLTTQAAIALKGPFNEEMLERVTVGARSEEWFCLTEALYFEARGESRSGQLAVAEVILNRVDSKAYPGSICGVVRQGMQRRNACQFSYNCDGRSNRIGNKPVFEDLGKLAWVMMEGKPRTLTGKALYYHNTSVKPRWARQFVRTARIGDHIFYRPPLKLSRYY